MNRFFVDERGGCIAVKDRENTDPEDHCLHPDTKGVVKYWHGQKSEMTCENCGHKNFACWYVKDCDKVAARTLCDQLNATNKL